MGMVDMQAHATNQRTARVERSSLRFFFATTIRPRKEITPIKYIGQKSPKLGPLSPLIKIMNAENPNPSDSPKSEETNHGRIPASIVANPMTRS